MWKYIAPVLLSMVPIIELRGGVPVGIGMGLNPFVAIALCAVGNMIPVPFIYFFARKFLTWGASVKVNWFRKVCTVFLEKGEKAGKKLTASAGRYGTFIALMLFVGIPLPGTGAWTGTLAASFLNIGIKSTTVSVVLGVLIAGVIVTPISMGLFSLI